MSMGLCSTRASRAREPRYKTLVIDMVGQLSRDIMALGRDDIVTRLLFPKVRKNGQQKTCNLFYNIAAKIVE